MQSPARAIRPQQVADLLGIGIATVWRWAKTREDFPKARRLSARCTVFDVQEIIQWRDAQMVQSRQISDTQKSA